MDATNPENPPTIPPKPKRSRTPLVAITTALVCSIAAIYGTLEWTKIHPEALSGQFPFGLKQFQSTPPESPLTAEEREQIAKIEQAHRIPAPLPNTDPSGGLTLPQPTAPKKTTITPEPKQEESITPPTILNSHPTPPVQPSPSVAETKPLPQPKAPQTNQKQESPKTIESVDPRDIGINNNDGPEKAYEQTKLTVGRTLAAQLENNEKQLLRLDVPVMYKSRNLRLDEETQKEAQELLKELKAESQKLQERKTSIQAKLNAWNKLITKTTPTPILLPESPTIPQNQSGNKLNRDENPNLAPGKGINYEVTPLPKTN